MLNLFDVSTELEGVAIELGISQNVLKVFEDFWSSEGFPAKTSKEAWMNVNFVTRMETRMSLIESAERSIKAQIAALEAIVAKLISASSQGKEKAA